MRTGAALVAAALAALVLGGGGDGGGQVGDEARLTPAAPASRLDVDAPGGDVLGLRLARIENPRMTPFGVVVSLVDGAEIGRIYVFPPDRTGDYMLSLTPGERSALARDRAVDARLDVAAPAPGLVVEIAVLPHPPSVRP